MTRRQSRAVLTALAVVVISVIATYAFVAAAFAT